MATTMTADASWLRGLQTGGVAGADVACVAIAIGAEPTLRGALAAIEREARRLTMALEGLAIVVDWARLACWTMTGPITDAAVHDLIREVAVGRAPRIVGNALFVPIGRAPAAAVIAVRRILPFTSAEVATLGALALGVAPTIDRLLR